MNAKSFWYIVAESKELKKNQALARTLFNEWLVIFRDENGKPVVLQDKCLHRNIQLSKGKVISGKLRCGYHGWTYDGTGQVVSIPAEGPGEPRRSRCAQKYQALEQDDYIYVRLEDRHEDIKPFKMPQYKAKGYTTIRLQNEFENTVTNCAENFVDIPHTTFVHPGIFRNPGSERISATVSRENGSVRVVYKGEKKNFGLFSFFLNPKGKPVEHTDEFFMPNVTSVNYWFGSKHFIITSQSVPLSEDRTLVYTDLTYNYGIWNWPSRPIVKRHGQAIIDQDVEILKWQMETIKKFGANFQNSPCDIIHTFIESIQSEIANDRDPRVLPAKNTEIEFWI